MVLDAALNFLDFGLRRVSGVEDPKIRVYFHRISCAPWLAPVQERVDTGTVFCPVVVAS
jgi:hypothetical protein